MVRKDVLQTCISFVSPRALLLYLHYFKTVSDTNETIKALIIWCVYATCMINIHQFWVYSGSMADWFRLMRYTIHWFKVNQHNCKWINELIYQSQTHTRIYTDDLSPFSEIRAHSWWGGEGCGLWLDRSLTCRSLDLIRNYCAVEPNAKHFDCCHDCCCWAYEMSKIN